MPASEGLYHLFWVMLDWIYPPTCGGCGERGARWCSGCEANARRVEPPLCPRCGMPEPRGQLCARCRQVPPSYQALRSWGFFEGGLRQALHRLKYRRDVGLGEALAKPLTSLFCNLAWPVDLVVPVPIGIARFEERGYNQSALLARPLAYAAGIPYRPQALQKIRHTESQIGLSAAQRKVNVSGAFTANQALVAGRKVLIVDDTATSGATLEACSQALLEGKADAVFALTLARAELYGSQGDTRQRVNP